jgi:heme/copper-type cytochrome/quinol oxidase subunit 3
MKKEAIIAFLVTLFLAITFTGLQIFEYSSSIWSIASGVYGSTFFMATGFHGFHVLIGSTFISICFIRLIREHFTPAHHFGFEAAAWY